MSLGKKRKRPPLVTELGKGVSLVAVSGASVGGVLGIAAFGLRAFGL